MKLLQAVWKIYRVGVFPFLHAFSGGGSLVGCRHDPSCSVYAVKVIESNGWFRGLLMATVRVLKCQPFSK